MYLYNLIHAVIEDGTILLSRSESWNTLKHKIYISISFLRLVQKCCLIH